MDLHLRPALSGVLGSCQASQEGFLKHRRGLKFAVSTSRGAKNPSVIPFSNLQLSGEDSGQ